ncbi:YggU family protein [Vibrio vulnificus]|nr:YggU family protein [Vibrio vulnificus]EHH1190148.1 YggU family protein [Vibrio vulnificus]EIA1304173.1 YggU family protein [Vibrio vulnificus]EKA7354685.1 YggU family protein [Vibrio vulnificus]
MSQAVWLDGEDVVLRLYIQPKASRDKILGLHGDELKIAITAPPIDGKANGHLTKLLGKWFKVAKNLVTIEKGELGRHKQVRVHAPQQIPDEVKAIL